MEDRTSSNIKLFNIQSGAATAADWAQLRKSMLDAAVAADVARALYPSAEEYLGDTGILTTYKVRHQGNLVPWEVLVQLFPSSSRAVVGHTTAVDLRQ